MKKLTIRKTSHKIWLGISILIVAYCMTIVASFVSKRIIRRNAMSINQASQKAIVLGQDFLSDLNKQMQLYQNAVVASELSMLDEAEKYRQSCMDILDALEGIEHTGSPTVGRIRALRNKIDRYGKDARRIYTSIIELEESGDVFASEDIYEKSQELAERRKRLLSESSQLTIATSKDLTDATNRIMATSERKKWFEVATLVIVLIVSLMIVTFVIRRFITKPIGQMTDAIEAMANGDFDINIEHESSDEIGRMADSMRIMVGAQKEKIAFAKSISEGDLGVRLKSRSEKDVLAKVFHSMIDSLNVKAKVAESIAKGDLNQNIQIVSDKDKFGKYFQSMVDNLREVVQQANVIAGGDYTSDIAPRSQEDELGYALQKMTQSLREMAERNERQVWLKTGESELSEKLRGDPEIGLLCQNAINFLAHYLGAQIGSLYVFDEDRGVLKLTGRYALDMDNHLNETIQIGQGLVGQAILEKRMLVTTDIPEDYGRIKSAHGAAPPRNIVVVPVIHEDKLSGALELGSFKEFSDRALDFLDLVMENLSIALHSAQSREKMKKLLQETKRQSDALHQQKDALKKSNKELEAQTLMLKRSEEQLKEQREELQATNEELERRTIDLEEQKTQMGKRNIELEVARNELEQKTKELEVTSKYKSEFLANMSHELRTPLNSLLILSRDLAENREGTLSEEQIESAKIIHKSGNDLLSLINDILDLSKVEAGKMPVHIETVHLKDIADNISMQFKPVIDEKGLEFNINLNSEIRPTIKTDQQRVEQIIKNLVSNASKFTDKGSITVDFRRADRDVELVETANVS